MIAKQLNGNCKWRMLQVNMQLQHVEPKEYKLIAEFHVTEILSKFKAI